MNQKPNSFVHLKPLTCTTDLQWLEHLWNHENMFQTGEVQANECYCSATEDIIGIDFSSYSNMKVFCVFLLKSPHPGDSYEYTKHTIINIKKEIHSNLSQIQ